MLGVDDILAGNGASEDNPTMFRNSFITTLCATLGLVPSGIPLGYVFVEPAMLVKSLLILLAAPWVFLIYRTLRAGVVLGRDGVEVRGLLRDRRVPWSDVRRIRLVLQSAMNTTVYIA